ncbi:hypothetical protein IV203_008124 [Nitzschia inconspicua]|uniref:Uncharacterized protein n=1 Tax=Nitzschia inconspicua TaxID=303405 RepID=A0A9K3PME0_9STRA|nr:hypothetical protein IV203_008124 [Nitzschia inconspicua]
MSLQSNCSAKNRDPSKPFPSIHTEILSFEDFYFSQIHLTVSHEYMFPIFSKAALKTKKSGESDSGVSGFWTRLFGEVRNTFEVLADEINEELGSYSNLRGSNQAMVESQSLGGCAPIFRSGLRSKSIHTIFDNIFGSTELLRQSGNSLSRWTMKISETVIRLHPKVRELLVRTLLMKTLLLRYDQFVDVLQSHPFARLVEGFLDEFGTVEDRYTCSAVRYNLLISRVNQALEKVCDDNSSLVFSKWIHQTRRSFLTRHSPGLPIETFRLYGVEPDGRGILMDTRTFIDHFNAVASIAQANHMKLQQHRHMLNDILQAFNVESKITSSFIVERLFHMSRSLRRFEENLIGEAPKPVTPPSKGVIRFSINSNGRRASSFIRQNY